MRKYKGKNEFIVITERIEKAIEKEELKEFVKKSLERFDGKDWGELEPTDAELNNDDEALGVYVKTSFEADKKNLEQKIWIKRNFDGENYIITILFPEEY